MAFRPPPGPGRFALGAGVRAAVIGVLAFGAVLAFERQLWASLAVVAALMLLAGLDLVRGITAADRALAQFIEGLPAEGYERPAPSAGLGRFGAAVERSLSRLAAARADRQRRIDHLEALTDNVTAALLVIDPAGEVVSANRAARQGFGVTPGPLSAVEAFPKTTFLRLRTMAPGAREIVRLVDGRAALAQAAAFSGDARFRVELAFQGAGPGDVLPGQALEGRLTLGGDRQALLLPAGPFLERTGGDWAMVLDASGKRAERRRLKVGRRNPEEIEVLAGLRPGERVITSDYTGYEKVERVVLTQ